jgi:hypothetical protein
MEWYETECCETSNYYIIKSQLKVIHFFLCYSHNNFGFFQNQGKEDKTINNMEAMRKEIDKLKEGWDLIALINHFLA